MTLYLRLSLLRYVASRLLLSFGQCFTSKLLLYAIARSFCHNEVFTTNEMLCYSVVLHVSIGVACSEKLNLYKKKTNKQTKILIRWEVVLWSYNLFLDSCLLLLLLSGQNFLKKVRLRQKKRITIYSFKEDLFVLFTQIF